MNSDWEDVSVGEITKWYSGGTPDKSNVDYWGGNIPWISARNMKTDRLYTSDTLISMNGLDNGSRLAPTDSLLLLVRGSELHNRIPICYAKREVAYNQDVKCITCNEKIFPLFLYYWIKSQETFLMKIVESTSIGAGKLDMKLLQNIRLCLPSKYDQKRIIETIVCLDDKIELNNHMNKTLEQMAQAIFKSWFVDFEPFQDGEFVDSELGRIPKGWRVATIEEISQKVICGKTPSTKKIEYYGQYMPFITIPDMHGKTYVTKTVRYLSKAGALSQHNKTLPTNSVAVSCIGSPGLAILTTEDSQTNQQINSVVCKEGISYLYVFLCINGYKEKIALLASGGSTIPNLNTTNFSKIKLHLPERTVLDDFHKIVESHFELIKKIQIQNQSLTSLRDTLLPKLMSGEIRVPVQED